MGTLFSELIVQKRKKKSMIVNEYFIQCLLYRYFKNKTSVIMIPKAYMRVYLYTVGYVA